MPKLYGLNSQTPKRQQATGHEPQVGGGPVLHPRVSGHCGADVAHRAGPGTAVRRWLQRLLLPRPLPALGCQRSPQPKPAQQVWGSCAMGRGWSCSYPARVSGAVGWSPLF